MTRFQLVFKYPEGDVTEMRENNADGEPHIDGTLVIDGQTYLIKGAEWLAKSDDIGDSMQRFVCTLVVLPSGYRI